MAIVLKKKVQLPAPADDQTSQEIPTTLPATSVCQKTDKSALKSAAQPLLITGAAVPMPFKVTAGSLLKVQEAAELLGVCTKTIIRWIKAGTLQATKVGGQWRIPRVAVLQLVFVHSNWTPANDP